MKMKKLMSICAMSLAVVCCTSVTTFAAQNNDARINAAKKVATNLFNGNSVIENLDITIKTPIKNYATGELIKEIEELNIADFDITKGIEENLEEIIDKQAELKKAGKFDEAIKTEESLMQIKDFVKDKLEEFEFATEDGELKECIEDYIKIPVGTSLTVGKNMNGKTTATLEDKRGNILFQVNSENIYNMKKELTGINSCDQLKNWMKNYLDDETIKALKELKALNK